MAVVELLDNGRSSLTRRCLLISARLCGRPPSCHARLPWPVIQDLVNQTHCALAWHRDQAMPCCIACAVSAAVRQLLLRVLWVGGMQSLQNKVPHHFEVMNQRKGFVRYMSPDLRDLVKQHADALENRETALTAILQVTLCNECSSLLCRLYPHDCRCMGQWSMGFTTLKHRSLKAGKSTPCRWGAASLAGLLIAS